jgi:hypothetical protein
MTKKANKHELDVDFIGGEELTQADKKALSDYFSKKKAATQTIKKRQTTIDVS